MSVSKGKVEQRRVRGRNTHDVANQLVENFNSSNGWKLVRVVTNLLTFEAIVERSVDQGEDSEAVTGKKTPTADVESPKEAPAVKKTTAKKPTTTTKK